MVYCFDFFINPNYRGHGNAIEFLLKVQRELKNFGYNHAWGYVAAANTPARWIYLMSGNKIVKRAISHEIFSKFLLQDWKVFIKNSRRYPVHPLHHRLIFSLQSRYRS